VAKKDGIACLYYWDCTCKNLIGVGAPAEVILNSVLGSPLYLAKVPLDRITNL